MTKQYNTHAGLFHTGEVTGYAICRLAGVADTLVRVTDLNNIPKEGITADIGSVYDESALLFDHHQGFLTRPDGYPYASAGLLWEKFGGQAIVGVLGANKYVNEIWENILNTVIKGIDAHDADNEYRTEAQCSAGFVKMQALNDVVHAYNTSDVNDHEAQYVAFHDACDVIQRLLVSKIRAAARYFQMVDGFEEKVDFVTPKIVQLKEGFPWKRIFHDEYPDVVYVVAPSNHPGSDFSLTAVTTEPHLRTCKIPIERPSWFSGFIHQGKWIAGSNSVEELLSLAQFNIEQHEEQNIFSIINNPIKD